MKWGWEFEFEVWTEELGGLFGEVVRGGVCGGGESGCNVLAEGVEVWLGGWGYVGCEAGFEVVVDEVEEERDGHLVEGGEEPVEGGEDVEEGANEETDRLKLGERE